MHLAFLYLEAAEKFSSPKVNADAFPGRHQFYTQLKNLSFSQISHVQRATISQSGEVDGINYYFVKDAFGTQLRWWQEPAASFELIAKLKPDVILVPGLNLPLNFRWLRRLTGADVKIIGYHTGETIWPSRNLWLQQFGLRVVDAFFFQKKQDSQPWKKASVILPRQPVFILTSIENGTKKSAEQLKKLCTDLVRTE